MLCPLRSYHLHSLDIIPCRLQLLAEYVAGLTASLQLLGLAVSDINSTLTHMRELALARAGLTQEQVRAYS